MIRQFEVYFESVDNVERYDKVRARNNAEAVQIVKEKHNVLRIKSVK